LFIRKNGHGNYVLVVVVAVAAAVKAGFSYSAQHNREVLAITLQ
jgi:hypothetical protein